MSLTIYTLIFNYAVNNDIILVVMRHDVVSYKDQEYNDISQYICLHLIDTTILVIKDYDYTTT
jgi:hypothetical protein